MMIISNMISNVMMRRIKKVTQMNRVKSLSLFLIARLFANSVSHCATENRMIARKELTNQKLSKPPTLLLTHDIKGDVLR